MIACAKAFNNYMEVLENNYKQTGEEYDKLVKSLMNSYDEVQDKIILAIEKEKIELDKYKNTRVAAIQANLKEQEIKEKLEFYCLHPTETEKDDIQEFLNSIKDLSDSYIKKLYEQFVQAYRRAEIKKYNSRKTKY